MRLHVMPTRTAGAAENMAVDFLLLQRYPAATVPRFRHYEWREPAFTFGYSQKLEWVRGQLPAGAFDLCRRPTGGGIVDHQEDWTYALVIPRGHPLEELRATQSYRSVHEALAAALCEQGADAVVKQAAEADEPPVESPFGVCFQRAEIFDVVHATTGAKIAGAAQKRNKHGLLFQGSVWRPAVGAAIEWDRFEEAFAGQLAQSLAAAAESVPWPELNEDEVSALTEHYASEQWLAHR